MQHPISLVRALWTFNEDRSFCVSDSSKKDCPIVYCNAGFLSLTGYSMKEIIGKNCRFLQGAGTEESSRARLRKGIKAKKTVVTVLKNYKKDGKPFWNRITCAPMLSENSDTPRFIVGIQCVISAEEAVKLRAELDAEDLREPSA